MDLLSIGIAVAAGAAAKAIGKSEKVGGKKPLQKVLAPIAALGVGIAATALSGGDVPVEVVLQDGGTAGAVAIALHSAGKNLLQLFKLL